MSLARPWWLAALLLLVPLLILHLRRPALAVREVPSLLVWERIAGSAASDTRRLRRPRHLLLLALQALILTALVLALAGPERHTTATTSTTVFVVDDSFWMQGGSRIADARADLQRLAAASHGPVAVVAASATPAVVYRGARSGLGSALGQLRPSDANGDLSAAITLGAGLLGGPDGRIVVLRAPEDALPAVTAARSQLTATVVGSPLDDQGIFAPDARCGIGPDEDCEVLATLRNGSSTAHVDRYTATVKGARTVSFKTSVAARSSTTIALTAQPGEILHLELQGHDALAADNAASVSVPGTDNAPDAATVTLVGDPTTALPLAQAFASVPGVTLLLRTPAGYSPRDARKSELVVLDGMLPAGGLPGSPAVLLIAPPSLPGGSIGGKIAAPTVSSTASGSPFLQGVDLASLNVDRGAASVLGLPQWMSPVVSTPSGPLLAAGDNGRQRVAVLAFDPSRSNLSQLAALPILARNIVGWADDWTTLGDDGSLRIDAVPDASRATLGTGTTFSLAGGAVGVVNVGKGVHAVSATGTGAAYRRTLVSSLAAPGDGPGAGAAPVDIATWASSASPASERSLAPWLIVLALVAMAAEWATWRRIRR